MTKSNKRSLDRSIPFERGQIAKRNVCADTPPRSGNVPRNQRALFVPLPPYQLPFMNVGGDRGSPVNKAIFSSEFETSQRLRYVCSLTFTLPSIEVSGWIGRMRN
ncbi:hypothetical protein NPIL_515051 [Nephila pilipes]|uniref:Uncharacterized protein n=1 Tax=Nephila pilipes TaxID=299642 RepID=A0A8X6TWE3_NEPPI|nr:hypothetical protein NPIL_515051 [Nephila pilipes]